MLSGSNQSGEMQGKVKEMKRIITKQPRKYFTTHWILLLVGPTSCSYLRGENRSVKEDMTPAQKALCI